MMTLSQHIRQCRQQAGLSQEQVAELVGVSRQAVAKWEAGTSAPSTENLLRLAGIFGVSVDSLVPRETSPLQKASPAPCGAADAAPQETSPEPAQKTSGTADAAKRALLRLFACAGCYLALFLLLKLLFGDLPQKSLLGWLLEDGSSDYLFGWLLQRKLFWLCMGISCLAALLGKTRFAAVTVICFAAGLALGQLFGPNPAGAPYGHGHYGWAIWGGIFLLSLAMGGILEHMHGKGIPLGSKKGALWAAATVAGWVFVVVFVQLSKLP